MGGSNYARLRIGIGNDFQQGRQVDFVLGEWSPGEQDQLTKIIKHACETIKSLVQLD